jgi:hypothetical protein
VDLNTQAVHNHGTTLRVGVQFRAQKKWLAAFICCLQFSACNPSNTAEQAAQALATPSIDPTATDSFTLRNSEIRADIINALDSQGIRYWINEDGSVGFFSVDAETVDNIGLNAIGAYAARN